MKTFFVTALMLLSISVIAQTTYDDVDLDEIIFYDEYTQDATSVEIEELMYVQEAYYQNNEPNYVDNGDGTITDDVNGLMWQKYESSDLLDWQDAVEYVQRMNAKKYLGYADWRIPTVADSYSLIIVTGGDAIDLHNWINIYDADGQRRRNTQRSSGARVSASSGGALSGGVLTEDESAFDNNLVSQGYALDSKNYVRLVRDL